MCAPERTAYTWSCLVARDSREQEVFSGGCEVRSLCIGLLRSGKQSWQDDAVRMKGSLAVPVIQLETLDKGSI